MNPDHLRLYLDFVHERHAVWIRRQIGLPGPWTEDPILRNYKFTNVFRVLDHGTQFVLRLLYEDEPSYDDALFRAFLYRYTNRPEPWERFYDKHGRFPSVADLQGQELLLQEWRSQKAAGLPIFGNAYKMFCGQENKGTDRLTWAVRFARDVFTDGSFVRGFRTKATQADRLEYLKTLPRVADFMGMQILTDIGYSPWLQADENEFVVPGPGARRGAAELSYTRDLQQLMDGLQLVVDCRVELPGGAHRNVSLMDVQNTLCEFSKYMRYYRHPAQRTTAYKTVHQSTEPFYPPHWY